MSASDLKAGRPAATIDGFIFACPACRSALELVGPDALRCPADQLSFQRRDGIWHMLLPDRASELERFISEYETVRLAEGRGADDPAYYRNLPYIDRSDPFAADWRIRATSYQALVSSIIEPLERTRNRPLAILDLGAGNGWLSNRIAQRRHRVAAIDLLTNPRDGLGAHRRYETEFTPIQAEFDHLPLASDQADLVIFNASIHYATSYELTLSEALRILRPGGILTIIDSPVYHDPTSGQTMVDEREASFRQRFGFASDALPSENYLTFDRLDDLSLTLGIEWRTVEPFYGLRWSLRPWKARLRRSREPAKFLVIAGKRRVAGARQKRLKWAIGRRWLRWRFLLTQRHRHGHLSHEEIDGRSLVILRSVFNPALFPSGPFLASVLDHQRIPPGSQVLELGTGSGIIAIAAAQLTQHITAVDINPEAVRCARINAQTNGVSDRIDVRLGDLFEPVQDERFDTILFNPPFYRGEPKDMLDHAWRSTDVAERFACEVPQHLNPGGQALVVLSTDGEQERFLETFRRHGLRIEVIARRELINETLRIYRLTTNE